MQENEVLNNAEKESGLSIKKVVGYLRVYWYLFVISFVVCIACAFIYLRYATPVYNVTAKVLLQDSQKGGSVLSPDDLLADFGMGSKSSNVENEIELMASNKVVYGAVEAAGLYIAYTIGGEQVMRDSVPFNVSIDKQALSNMIQPMELNFLVGDKDVQLAYSYMNEKKSNIKIASFPANISTPAGDVVVTRNESLDVAVGDFSAIITPVGAATEMYKSAFSVSPLSKTSSVAVLSYITPYPANGVEFLNAVMESFNNLTNDNKRQVARRTEQFISERLDTVKIELEEMESELAAYKMQNELINPELDAAQITKNKAEYVKMLETIDLKIEASKYLNDFVNDPKNDMQVMPASFGVDIDPALVRLIENYNNRVLERKAMSQTVTAENPAFKNITIIVKSMQEDLRAALKALDKSLAIERKSVAILAEQYTGRFEMSPEVERQLMTISRECEIKSGLYVMLLQKYEETLLSIEVTSDNLTCIDTPYVYGIVSPNGKMIYLLAFFMALVLPIAYIYIKEKMRTKFISVAEIQEVLYLPFVGSIPIKKPRKGFKKAVMKPIVVQKNKNDVMAEAFRTLRTNLQFVMKKSTGKVILFTSTVSGEGKTFVASNLAVSTVLLGKKVLLIGCDIRRPRLAELFNFNPKREGLTSYLVAPEDEVAMLDNLIVQSPEIEGLDILAAGLVPPNPAELLSGRNFDRAIEYLKEKYDYILLDGAPVGLVSDSMIASRVADIVVYVMRLNYTFRTDAGFIASLCREKKLENVAIVVNGEDVEAKTYGSRGSNRYSSHGYSYLYSEEVNKK